MSTPTRGAGVAGGLGRGALALLLVWAGLSAADEPPYDALPHAKAMAVLPGQPESVRGVSHSEPHDLAAAAGALRACQSQAPAQATCELIRLNDEDITSGREIRERVPEAPHPLFLWRYRQGANTVYLVGSIHILKPTLYPLPRQLEQAFHQSDHLVLEVNLEAVPEHEMRRRTLAHARLPEGSSLEDVLPEDLLGRLQRRLADYGMTTDVVSTAKPALVMNQLVVSRLMALGYLPGSGLESHFLGQRTRQRILELESLEQQLELLFDQPLPTQVQLLAETLDVEPDIEPLLADLLTAWLSGDDARFLALFKAQAGDSPESRAFNRALLSERNDDMAAGIRGYLERAPGDQPRTYFVLVGAAHLVGDEGVVRQLQHQGFEARRIMSNDTL